MRIQLFVAAVLIAGCGPRADFEGEYAGTIHLTVRAEDGRESEATDLYTMTITASEDGRELTLSGTCSLTASVAGSSYSLNSRACPGMEVSFDDGSTCTQTVTYDEGSGRLVGSQLDATHSGHTELSDCSDGFVGTFTFEEEIDVEREE